MAAYRSEEDVARIRAAELADELSTIDAENGRLGAHLARAEAELGDALDRLSIAGLWGGEASAGRDRVGVGALALALTSLSLTPFHFLWVADARRAPAAVPALLWLAVPAAVAVALAARHRRTSTSCRVALWLGALLVFLGPLHILFETLR